MVGFVAILTNGIRSIVIAQMMWLAQVAQSVVIHSPMIKIGSNEQSPKVRQRTELAFEGRIIGMQTQSHINKKRNYMLAYMAMSNPFYHQLVLENGTLLFF